MIKEGKEIFQSETNIAQMLRITDDTDSQYDEACKKVLSEKVVLAWILQTCVEEFRDCSIDDIMSNYIEGTPIVGEYPVLPDEKMPLIHGIGTEDKTVNEGTIRYDVRFKAKARYGDELISLIINVEAQNKYHNSYPLLKRGIYYGSRMISSQKGTEFIKDQYGKIKKVYSIWVILNSPKSLKNTITSYSIQEKNLIGKVKEPIENYDLMAITMIGLGDVEDENASGLLKLLRVLLTNEVCAEEKKQILTEEFQIEMTQSLEKEVSQMCNLSQGIREQAIKEGIEQGIEQGIKSSIQLLATVDTEKDIIKKLIIEEYNLSTTQAEQYVEKYYVH